MPAAQITAIETDHDRGRYCVNFGVWDACKTEPRDALADAAGSIADRPGIAAEGLQLGKEIGHFSERRERGELGCHIGEFRRHPAFERKSRKTSWFFGECVAARTILEPAHAEWHVPE
jgi:hypothetical protein